MKRIYIYNLFLSLCLSLTFFSSCIDESLEGGNNIDMGDEVEVTFQYELSDISVPETRAQYVTETTMNKVSAINVLVYSIDEDGDEVFAYHRDIMNNSLTHNGSSGNFKVRLARSKEGEKYSIDFIINNPVTVKNFLASNPIGSKREEVRAVICPNGFSINEGGSLSMWAGVAPMVITSETDFPELSFIRSFARIDVGLNMDENDVAQVLPNFRLTYAGFTSHRTLSHIIPDRADIENNKAIAPSIPSSVPYNPVNQFVSKSNITDNRVIAGLFAPEARSEDVSGRNFFSVIIGGYYTDPADDTSLYYYRIALTDPNDPEKRINILRNHKYRINILNVNGPGQTSTSLARTNDPSMNVIYELTVHEQGDINHVVYNNSNYLGVSTTYLEYDGTANATGEIKVKTNLSSGWKVTMKDENGGNPEWVTITPTTGTGNTTGTVHLTLQPNLGKPRSALLTFTAGTLTITVRILQNGEWYISSNYETPTLMNGEGDAYDVSVYGNVPPNLQVRAYGPLKNLAISYDTLTYAGGVVAQGSPQTQKLEIIGNAWIPMKIRDVEFQYSTDGTNWITFEEGPQGKGHFRLKSTGRIVALYNMEDDNGNTLNNISWAEAMGVDYESDVSGYVGDYTGGYDPNHGNGHNAHSFGYNYDDNFPWRTNNHRHTVYHNYDDVATRKTDNEYLPSPAVTGRPGTGYPINGNLFRIKYPTGVTERDGKTGCAIYNEDKYGFADKYPKGRWRLPSIRELEEMAIYEAHIGDLPLTGSDDNYWSSTEYGRMGLCMQAMYFHFRDGAVIVNPMDANQNSNYKSLHNSGKKLYVRCVFVPDDWVAPNNNTEIASEYFD